MVWRAGANAESIEGEPRWAARIFVAATNTNSVYTVGVSEDKELRVVENINVSMTPRQPVGMSPSGLALSADGHRMYVACSDANAVAVVDLASDRSYVRGFIPAGCAGRAWPTASAAGGWPSNVENPRPLTEAAQAQLEKNLATARELGEEVIATTDDDLVRGLLRVARAQNATQIIVGKPPGTGWLEWLRASLLLRRLARESGDIDLHVVRSEKAARQRASLADLASGDLPPISSNTCSLPAQ